MSCKTTTAARSAQRRDPRRHQGRAGRRPSPLLRIHSLASWRDKLCFVAYPGKADSAYGLWCSDGSTAGTILLAEIQEAPHRTPASWRLLPASSSPPAETGEDLWVTDGTPAAPRALADFDPAPLLFSPATECEVPDVDSMSADGDAVYFVTHRQGHGAEIWRSDGTEEGTRPLIQLPGSAVSGPTTAVSATAGSSPPPSAANPSPSGRRARDFPRPAPSRLCDGGECPVFGSFFSESSTDAPALPRQGRGSRPRALGHGRHRPRHAAALRRLSRLLPGVSAPSSGPAARLGVSAGRTWFPPIRAPRLRRDRGRALGDRRHAGGDPPRRRARRGHRRRLPRRPRLLRLRPLAAPALRALGGGRAPAAPAAVDRAAAVRAQVPALCFNPPGRRAPAACRGRRAAQALEERRHAGRNGAARRLPTGFEPRASRGVPLAGGTRSSSSRSTTSKENPKALLHPSSGAATAARPAPGGSPRWSRKIRSGPPSPGPAGSSSWSGIPWTAPCGAATGRRRGRGRSCRPLPGVRCPTALVDLGPRFLFVARVEAGRRSSPRSSSPTARRPEPGRSRPSRAPGRRSSTTSPSRSAARSTSGSPPLDSEPELWQNRRRFPNPAAGCLY